MSQKVENMTALVIEGNVSFEGEHCAWYILGKGVNSYLGTLFLNHFAPTQLQRRNEMPRDLYNALNGVTQEEERKVLVRRLEEYLTVHVGSFRVTFEPLSSQSDTLTLEGELGVDSNDLYFESPTQNDWLGKIFLRHYYPENTPCEDEYPEEDYFDCGAFRITFEALHDGSIVESEHSS